MKVLLATPGTDVGGAERVVITLARALPERGHEVTLWGPAGALEPELDGAPLERSSWPTAGARRPASPRRCASLATAMRRVRPHVVHAHNPRVSALAALGVGGSAAGRAARRCSRRSTACGTTSTGPPPLLLRGADARDLRIGGPRGGAARGWAAGSATAGGAQQRRGADAARGGGARRARRGAGPGRRTGGDRGRPPRRAEEPRALPRRRRARGGRRGRTCASSSSATGRCELSSRRRRALGLDGRDAHRRPPRRPGAARARRPRRVLLGLGRAAARGARSAGGRDAGAQHARRGHARRCR